MKNKLLLTGFILIVPILIMFFYLNDKIIYNRIVNNTSNQLINKPVKTGILTPGKTPEELGYTKEELEERDRINKIEIDFQIKAIGEENFKKGQDFANKYSGINEDINKNTYQYIKQDIKIEKCGIWEQAGSLTISGTSSGSLSCNN